MALQPLTYVRGLVESCLVTPTFASELHGTYHAKLRMTAGRGATYAARTTALGIDQQAPGHLRLGRGPELFYYYYFLKYVIYKNINLNYFL